MTVKKLKSTVHQYLQKAIDDKINDLQSDIYKLKESRNNETKSTVGDKYETARAMAQLELQKLQIQLVKTKVSEKTLTQIEVEKTAKTIGFGSLVKTNTTTYYISIPYGKIMIYNTITYAVSAISPIGSVLIGKSSGENFLFNGKQITIEAIA